VALAHGVTPIDWLRDASAYGLFAVVALVALDAHGADRRALLALAVVVGALATVSYIIAWQDIRSISESPIERLVLPSGALASMFFVIAAAYSFRPSRTQLIWAIAAGVTLGLFLTIGTRGRIPFVVLPLLLAALSPGGLRGTVKSWAAQFAVAAIVVVSVPLIQEMATPAETPPEQRPTEVLGRRLDSIEDLVTNPAGDGSMRERVSQTVGAWRLFVENPVLGAGPGALISWNDYAGSEQKTWTVDSPLAILSKFGSVGLVAGLIWVLAFTAFARQVLGHIRGSPEWLILVGQIVVLVYATLFSPPMQDKGMAFALMLTLAMVLSAYRASHSIRAAQARTAR
jgi:hypothetical protein